MRGTIIAPLWLLACGGPQQQIEIGPPPAKMTKGTLAGPLCGAGQCTCRSAEADPGAPDGGRKRYEIRLGSAYDLWVTMKDTVLYKSPERAETCFYIDLAPGEHALELRASNPSGVSFDLQIHEYGTKTKSWYDTFVFRCGHPGVCSFDELDGKQADFAKVKRNLHDACGSTKVKGVVWDHGKSPDQSHPSELAVRLTLDIYKFEPWKAKGDTSCGIGGGKPPKDAPATEEPATQ
jgi:hypothetical protein